MKKLFLLLLFTFSFSNTFSQTYIFNGRNEALKYTTQSGETKYKDLGNTIKQYKFVFEYSVDGRNTLLFTLYENGKEAFWAAEIEEYGYEEIKDRLYKRSLYLNTLTNKKFYFFISENNKSIICLYNDKLITYN